MKEIISSLRAQFPALASGNIYFDNPGGTQVPLQVINRMRDYLIRCNANHGGAFASSRQSDEIVVEAHRAMADFLGALSEQEIIFGQNMTTLTMQLARSLAKWIKKGDEIIVTRLDHDANIAPWLLLAEDVGAVVRWVNFVQPDCELDMNDFGKWLNKRTKLVAVGYASNAVGTVNDVCAITRLAKSAGSLVFVDAVHFAPHGSIDVHTIGCDFLACSTYKFFGPHLGVLYGRQELLEKLPAYKVRPAADRLPFRFETGTLNHEGLAGVLGIMEYLQWLGGSLALQKNETTRKERLKSVLQAIRLYESSLGIYLLTELRKIKGLQIWGLSDVQQQERRVPTVSFTITGLHPRHIAEALAKENICVWDGNFYAQEIVKQLGLEKDGGLLRVGLAHYNTVAEIDRLLTALHCLSQR